ncbi:MAG: hypothetical protein BWY56_02536 [Acidobacteria bacterium ADurb.Bin340]|nr:MAG: hypothetical protein BWY56_02536 [Acidobacteria bacterium ADurb.Bin340]
MAPGALAALGPAGRAPVRCGGIDGGGSRWDPLDHLPECNGVDPGPAHGGGARSAGASHRRPGGAAHGWGLQRPSGSGNRGPVVAYQSGGGSSRTGAMRTVRPTCGTPQSRHGPGRLPCVSGWPPMVRHLRRGGDLRSGGAFRANAPAAAGGVRSAGRRAEGRRHGRRRTDSPRGLIRRSAAGEPQLQPGAGAALSGAPGGSGGGLADPGGTPGSVSGPAARNLPLAGPAAPRRLGRA